MANGFGLMEVSGLAGQTGILGNLQQEEIMTILSSGGVRTIENGTMFKNLTEEEFYVNMTQQPLQQQQNLHQPPLQQLQQPPQQPPPQHPLQHLYPVIQDGLCLSTHKNATASMTQLRTGQVL